MMVDLHNLQLCLPWKSAPTILWSVGSAVHGQLWQIRMDNPAVMAARLSLMSLFSSRASKPRVSRQVEPIARLDYRPPR